MNANVAAMGSTRKSSEPSAPPRILIVTYNWPPRNAIGTHRPYSWARYWPRLGARITVLTARKCAFDEPLDLELPPLTDVEVIEVPYLSEARSSDRNSAWGRVRSAIYPQLKSVRTTLDRWLGVTLDPRDAWVRAARPRAEAIAHDFDFVVSTFGPRSAHMLASAAKQANPSLSWIADYRDLWSHNARRSFSSRSQRRERAKEITTVRGRADLITTVSDELAGTLESTFGQKVVVIENGFDVDREAVLANHSRQCELRARPARIVYTGLIGLDRRNPTPLFEAIRELHSESRVRPEDLQVDFYGGRQPGLDRLVASMGMEAFVTIHGHVDRTTALARQRDAAALLLLESPASDAKGILTGKLFEYMAAGVPVLSLGSPPDSAIARVLERCGVGVCVGTDVTATRRALEDILSGVRPLWFGPRLDSILSYSRENQAERMLDSMMAVRDGRRQNHG